MAAVLRSRVMLSLAACACIGGAVGGQQVASLNTLTVPADRLPAACTLKTAASSADLRNPLSGRRLRVAVHMELYGRPRLPDAPPLEGRELASLESRMVEHVAEAYRAQYVTTDGPLVFVSAIRFDDPKNIPPEQERTRDGSTIRFVQDARVVAISGRPKDACFQVVSKLIQSSRE
jgi:hypothetical protein